jgi:hypothetical protein
MYDSPPWKIPMPRYFGALTLILLVGMVLTRVFVLKRRGIYAMKFGNIDKKDFLLVPFVLFYFYHALAAALNWPTISTQLKSASFCSCGQPENSHSAGILPIGDEFRERIIFWGIEEIIRNRPPQSIGYDEF